MIRCTTDHNAIFFNPETGERTRAPIVAWDNEGRPLVAGRTGLIRADFIETFERIAGHVEPHVYAVPLTPTGEPQ